MAKDTQSIMRRNGVIEDDNKFRFTLIPPLLQEQPLSVKQSEALNAPLKDSLEEADASQRMVT